MLSLLRPIPIQLLLDKMTQVSSVLTSPVTTFLSPKLKKKLPKMTTTNL